MELNQKVRKYQTLCALQIVFSVHNIYRRLLNLPGVNDFVNCDSNLGNLKFRYYPFISRKHDIQEPDNLSGFDFESFAKSNFQNGEIFQFSRVPLMSSLLSTNNVEDRKVSMFFSLIMISRSYSKQ